MTESEGEGVGTEHKRKSSWLEEGLVISSPVQHFPNWPKLALLWEMVVPSERNCLLIWAASSRSLLDFGKWCLEMLESLGYWCLVPSWELRAGNCYVSQSFSGLLCFTGSPKMHHLWDLKCWFQGDVCVCLKSQMGWPGAWMIHLWSALAPEPRCAGLAGSRELTIKVQYCVALAVGALHMTDTGFYQIWETAEFLELGRKQKKKTLKR